ncbi:DUF4367 domain-containing protein [Butyrivibrio proteoclasticus]|nr:DUF4367 domain-containing protein [Butyrivibrio proteoclasticus]
MGKYNDVMNKIEVTEEMRSRILQNIADEFKDEEFKDEEFKAEKSKGEDAIVRDLESDNDNTIDFKSIIRYAGLAAAAVILFVGGAVVFGSRGNGLMKTTTMSEVAMEVAHEAAADLHHETADDVKQENELIKGSWVKYDSVQKLSKVAGAEFSEIEYLSSISSETDYYLDGETTATIVYDVTGNQITVRETKLADVAKTGGAFAEDQTPQQITIDGVDVRLYGTEDGFDTAIWVINEIEYTLESVEKISLDEMTELMNNIFTFD